MEDTKVLDDIIGDLLDHGYPLGFEELEQAKLDLGEEHIQILSANEFVIDDKKLSEQPSTKQAAT